MGIISFLLVQRRSQRHAVSLWFRRFSEVTTPTTGFRAVLQPLWLFRGRSAKNPCAVGIAVRCDTGRGASATPSFHLLLFRPVERSVALRKPPDLSLCETRPKRGLRGGLWVFSRPRWETRHTRATTVAHRGDIHAPLHPHHRSFVLILVGGFILGFFGWDDLLACEGFFEFFFSVV